MKAWVLHDAGDIRYEEVPVPEPAAGEVLIRVGAVGICGSDIPRIYDTGAHRMPLIPGHEFAGEVAGTGEGVDKSWAGKRVGVFPLISCRKCSQCGAGRYELCRNYDYIGSRRDGAFAEYVTVPAANLIEIPDGISYEIAAMSEPMAVAVHAIRRVMGIERAGDMPDGNAVSKKHDIRIAVYGLGTIGMFITMFLKAAGYDNLILIGNKDSQRKTIISMGIPEGCYYDNTSGAAAGQIKDKGAADIVFECVGRTQTYADSIDMTAPMGSVMLVGNPYSDMVLLRDIYWKILRNQLTVTGTWNSSFVTAGQKSGMPYSSQKSATDEGITLYNDARIDDWHYVYKLLSEGTIHPDRFITHRLPLEDLRRGFEIMRDKSEEYLKIMATHIDIEQMF